MNGTLEVIVPKIRDISTTLKTLINAEQTNFLSWVIVEWIPSGVYEVSL